MLTILGWSLAALFGFLLLIIQWSWRKHAIESVMQSEFVAILFLDRVIYENNRRAYIEWVDELSSDVKFGDSIAASNAARNIAISYIGKVGGTVGLHAVLTNYKAPQGVR